MKDIKGLIEELKQSPVFNMSLSSKELFHSNFLAWIIKKYPNLFIDELSENYDIDKNTSIRDLKREVNNTDIKIQLPEKEIVIENKVKSVPDEKQLKKYKGNDNKNLYLLLSFIKPSFNVEEIGWKFISYNKLAKLLKNISENIINNEYDKLLLDDYISVILNIDSIVKYFDITQRNSTFDFYSHEKYGYLKDIRFHDFAIKSVMSQLSELIYTKLKSYFIDDKIIIGSWYDADSHPKSTIIIQTSYSNGKGILHIEYVCKKNVLIGIMIDGNNYNQYVTIINGNYTDRIQKARYLRDNNLWFNFNSNIEKSKMRNEFNKYAPNMSYKYAHIPNDIEIIKLIDIIKRDIENAIKINDI